MCFLWIQTSGKKPTQWNDSPITRKHGHFTWTVSSIPLRAGIHFYDLYWCLLTSIYGIKWLANLDFSFLQENNLTGQVPNSFTGKPELDLRYWFAPTFLEMFKSFMVIKFIFFLGYLLGIHFRHHHLHEEFMYIPFTTLQESVEDKFRS